MRPSDFYEAFRVSRTNLTAYTHPFSAKVKSFQNIPILWLSNVKPVRLQKLIRLSIKGSSYIQVHSNGYLWYRPFHLQRRVLVDLSWTLSLSILQHSEPATQSLLGWTSNLVISVSSFTSITRKRIHNRTATRDPFTASAPLPTFIS